MYYELKKTDLVSTSRTMDRTVLNLERVSPKSVGIMQSRHSTGLEIEEIGQKSTRHLCDSTLQGLLL